MATLAPTMVELVEKGAPRVIQDDTQLEAYTEKLFALTELKNPSSAEAETIELLSLLIESYENKVDPIKPATPVEILRFLMESHDLTQSDLEEEIGSQSLVSHILQGRRQLTPDHMRALAKRFHVAPSLFL